MINAMNALKYVLFILVGLILGAVVVLIFPPSPFKKALGTFAEGNFYLQNKLPNTALERYEQAKKQWPLLRLDSGFQQQVNKAKEEINNKVALTIFLKDNASETQVQSLIQEIKAVNGVRDAKFISEDEALARTRENIKDDPELLKFLAKDIIPATIEVYLDDPSLKEQISQLAESKTFVDEVVKSLDTK